MDGYTLLSRLGEGGMGVVHLAQRPGERRVALKVLRPHIIGDDEARQRLAREVASLSRIRSPRIAEIVDADPFGDIPYVATRYVPGLSLHDHVVEEGVLTGPDLVHFAAGLAEALGAVHACGVLHRDIKPSNVLLEGRNPVLIDFGLARLADDPKLTHTGWLLGTPGYLAPEILYGDDATTASDVHSWAACVAYAGLGRPPFGRGPGMAIMDRVRRGEHDLDGLPPRMAALLDDALAPEPHRRPTLPELIAELRPEPALEDDATLSFLRDEDPFTVPLAVAARAGIDLPTEVERPVEVELPTAVETTLQPPPTRPYTQFTPSTPAPAPVLRPVGPPAQFDPRMAAQTRQPAPLGVPQQAPWVPAPPPPFGLRLRRGLVFVALALLGAASVAAMPYVAATVLLLGAWLLRSGSFAASAHGNRRLLRGRKWFDGPQVLIASPWHLVQALPGSLGLGLWSAGLGLAGGLLGYAFGFSAVGVLAVVGVLYTGSLGLGPGGSRVRGPLRRVVHPLAERLGLWVAGLLILLGLASFVAALAEGGGPNWTPAQSGPLSSLGESLQQGLP